MTRAAVSMLLPTHADSSLIPLYRISRRDRALTSTDRLLSSLRQNAVTSQTGDMDGRYSWQNKQRYSSSGNFATTLDVGTLKWKSWTGENQTTNKPDLQFGEIHVIIMRSECIDIQLAVGCLVNRPKD